MTALRKTLLVEEEALVTATVDRATRKLYLVTRTAPAAAPETVTEGGALKNIALFLLAPFIGLAYIVALPFVALGVLAVMAVRTAAKYEVAKLVGRAAMNAGLFAAAPVIGLAYIVFFPVVGLGALVWIGARAAVRR